MLCMRTTSNQQWVAVLWQLPAGALLLPTYSPAMWVQVAIVFAEDHARGILVEGEFQGPNTFVVKAGVKPWHSKPVRNSDLNAAGQSATLPTWKGEATTA